MDPSLVPHQVVEGLLHAQLAVPDGDQDLLDADEAAHQHVLLDLLRCHRFLLLLLGCR